MRAFGKNLGLPSVIVRRAMASNSGRWRGVPSGKVAAMGASGAIVSYRLLLRAALRQAANQRLFTPFSRVASRP